MIWCETHKSSHDKTDIITGRHGNGTKNEKFVSGVHTNLIKVINLILRNLCSRHHSHRYGDGEREADTRNVATTTSVHHAHTRTHIFITITLVYLSFSKLIPFYTLSTRQTNEVRTSHILPFYLHLLLRFLQLNEIKLHNANLPDEKCNKAHESQNTFASKIQNSHIYM